MSFPVLFRSYGGDNRKGRPEWFSKATALASVVRAAEVAGAELVFVNNGPIPEDRLRVMESAGTVVTLPGVGVHESYLSALRLATSGRWADDQLVWISEDDYLYHPEALRRLERAAETITTADYFALYANNPVEPQPRPAPPVHRPRGWVDLPPWDVDGERWERIYSTTATFGARVGALREDLSLFRFATVPHKNMFRDHDTSMLYQGFETYPWSTVARAAVGRSEGTPRERLREVAMSPFYAATNLRSHRRRDRRRLLVAPRPDLATHGESGYAYPGQDWAGIAAEADAWQRARDGDAAG
ncbi:hypothetical protein [Modestobacter sp. Leaf380]|uniref:hypothetical protein n=1 Tax=Modestobacter sp. Leaf380 TaxID=1736356 RepID=UPI0006F1E5FC|nr:hypothetical protein [Modestobacter sp. Leaf380]KQS68802.1 hypothetical protein ASG41_07805 [Modestobacter sp. Leaf380]